MHTCDRFAWFIAGFTLLYLLCREFKYLGPPESRRKTLINKFCIHHKHLKLFKQVSRGILYRLLSCYLCDKLISYIVGKSDSVIKLANWVLLLTKWWAPVIKYAFYFTQIADSQIFMHVWFIGRDLSRKLFLLFNSSKRNTLTLSLAY